MNQRVFLFSALFLTCTGCATLHVPSAKDEVPVFPQQIESAGYLDLMHTFKLAYKDSSERNSMDIPASFKFSIRKNENAAPWVPIEAHPYITRMRLAPGEYFLRINVNDSAYIKDVPVTVEKDRYAMVFYSAEHEFIKNPNSVHEEVYQEAGGGGASPLAALVASVAAEINKHMYFIDIQYYPPIPGLEPDLLKSLVNPDWRERTYVALLLGEHGTSKALPALQNLHDDVLVREPAQRAIEKLNPSGATIPAVGRVVFHLQPPPNLNLDTLSLGQKAAFTVLEDVTADGKEIAKKGDTLTGEILFGRPRGILGYPQLALVQFAYFEKGNIRIPIMKAVEIHGSSRAGWVWGLSLPTLCFSLFIPGGALDTAKDIKITSMPIAP
jgi:hypothetical protein